MYVVFTLLSRGGWDVRRQFFEENHYFGLRAEDVIFFAQGTMPCFDLEGKLLLETPRECLPVLRASGRLPWRDQGVTGASAGGLASDAIFMHTDSLAVSPDGNGSIYPSLRDSGSLEDMQRRGVTCLHVFSVDNVLVTVADPLFIGFCLEAGADCGNKVITEDLV
jgi:UDP-N-acetylglucosamine/UDP-N-acetylgalactosamine diphosphorylase